jgi:trk system potassium uptake protein TrkA
MKRDKIIIIGCSRFGSSIATNLSRQGQDVIVIDDDESAFRKLDEEFSGYQMVGNGTDIDFLKEIGIEQTKMAIASTDDDNINIFIAQISSVIFQVPEVYVRLNDPNKAIVFEHLNIKAIYPFQLSMQEFERMRKEGE